MRDGEDMHTHRNMTRDPKVTSVKIRKQRKAILLYSQVVEVFELGKEFTKSLFRRRFFMESTLTYI